MTGIHNYSIMWNSFTTPKTFNIGSHRMTLELAPLDHSNLIEIILLTHSVLAILAFFLFLQKVKHIFSCSLLLHWHHLEISLLLYSHNGSLLSFIEAVDAPCSHLLIILPCFFFLIFITLITIQRDFIYLIIHYLYLFHSILWYPLEGKIESHSWHIITFICICSHSR